MSTDPTTEAPRAQRDAQRVKLTAGQAKLLRQLPDLKGARVDQVAALIRFGLAEWRGEAVRRFHPTAAGRAWLAGEGGGCTMT